MPLGKPLPLSEPQATCLFVGCAPQLWGQSEAVNTPFPVNSRHPHQVGVREARGGQIMLFSVLEPLITQPGFYPTILYMRSF